MIPVCASLADHFAQQVVGLLDFPLHLLGRVGESEGTHLHLPFGAQELDVLQLAGALGQHVQPELRQRLLQAALLLALNTSALSPPRLTSITPATRQSRSANEADRQPIELSGPLRSASACS